jgi:hypothetical protein
MKSAFTGAWLALAASLGLAACATNQQTAAAQCGVGGAAAAYLICKATGGSDSHCAKVAAGVGVLGAAGCYVYADNLERRKRELAGHENDLTARLTYVRGLNDDAKLLNDDLTQRVAATTKKTDDLVAQIQAKKVAAEQVNRERQARDKQIEEANKQVARGNEALAEVKAYRTQAKPASTDLDTEIAKQEVLLKDAEQRVAQLTAQRARLA